MLAQLFITLSSLFCYAAEPHFSNIEQFENPSIEKLRHLAANDLAWRHPAGWGRFGNYFSWKAVSYDGRSAREDVIAKHLFYGKRGVSFDEFQNSILIDFSKLENNEAGRRKLAKWLTAHYSPVGGSKGTNVIARKLSRQVFSLDSSLHFYVGREKNEYKDLYLTAVIDSRNREAFSVSVGSMDLEERLE